jgi:hypothetical protein
MSLVWIVPVLLAVFGGVALVALLRGTATSARELAAEVARFGELHASLTRVHSELQRGHVTVRQLRAN